MALLMGTNGIQGFLNFTENSAVFFFFFFFFLFSLNPYKIFIYT